MKRLLNVLILLNIIIWSFLACSTLSGKNESKKRFKGIDVEFQYYVNKFILVSEGKVKSKDLKGLTIGFKKFKDSETAIGFCFKASNEITVDSVWWAQNKNVLDRESLIFHEMGHCILDRDHTQPSSSEDFWPSLERLFMNMGLIETKGPLPDGCPGSIMHPSEFSVKCYSDNYDFYIKELFNPKLRK